MVVITSYERTGRRTLFLISFYYIESDKGDLENLKILLLKFGFWQQLSHTWKALNYTTSGRYTPGGYTPYKKRLNLPKNQTISFFFSLAKVGKLISSSCSHSKYSLGDSGFISLANFIAEIHWFKNVSFSRKSVISRDFI